MRLTVMRHAPALDRGDWPDPDAERPLAAGRLGELEEWCRQVRGLVDGDLILTSEWQRAWHTAAVAGRVWQRPVRRIAALSGEVLDPAAVAAVLSGQAADDLVLIGHEPALSGLVGWLTGGRIRLRKSAMAQVRGDPVEGGCRLAWLLAPKQGRRLA